MMDDVLTDGRLLMIIIEDTDSDGVSIVLVLVIVIDDRLTD